MPNTFPAPALNYAEVWMPDLLEIKIQEALTSPFITTNVKWLGGKTFHYTSMQTSGFKNHSRLGGWNKGAILQEDHEYKVTFDRDVSFFIDKADVDETNYTASMKKIAQIFEKTQATPENDAYFFSKVAATAKSNNLYTETEYTDYTPENVLTKLKQVISKVKMYRRSIILYVSSHIMDQLELTTQIQRKIEMTTIADGGIGIETRFTMIDGVPILEVIDESRFYDDFDFAPELGGFTPKETSKKLNVLAASVETVVTVPKISSIYFWGPGQHQLGDGWYFARRDHYDTFVFPNGRNGKIDSIFVDLDATDEVEE